MTMQWPIGTVARGAALLTLATLTALAGALGSSCGRDPQPPVATLRQAAETARWTQRTAVHSPTPRYGLSLVYEQVHGVTLLYGGAVSTGPVSDVWKWDGTDWSQLCTATSCGTAPPARSFAAATNVLNTPGGLLVFGGLDGSANELQDTYQLSMQSSGAIWLQKCSPCTIPAARAAAMVIDGLRSRTLMFGGANDAVHDNVTREWTGSTWSVVCDPGSSCSSPPGLRGHALAYHPVNQNVVLFGGHDGSAMSAATWLLSFNATSSSYEWAQASPATSPEARLGAAMVYDPNDEAVVVFGGTNGSTAFGDTWLYKNSTWTKETTTPQPAGRYGAGMVFATANNASVLYGGLDPTTSLMPGDTWERHDGTWVQRAVPPRSDTSLAYDSTRQRVVAFGGMNQTGTNADTLEWDGVAWRTLAPSTSPPRRRGAGMVYHEAEQVTLVMAGVDQLLHYGDTWAWNGTTWTKVYDSGGVLPLVSGIAAAYDPDRQRVVAFGGATNATSTNGTYELRREGGSWIWQATCTSPCTPPPARTRAAMIYDPVRKQTLLFGGFAESSEATPLDDLWAWDGSTWTRLCNASPCNAASQRPSARGGARMAFDAHRGRALLFGGFATTSYFAEMWEWDGAAWSGPVASGPAARRDAGMAYDAARRATLIFGGGDASGAFADTWEYRTVGSLCTNADQCNTGFCVDGVCCESACDSPCGVCSVAQGSSADGICGAAPPNYAGGCPNHVKCDGTQTTCPSVCAATGAPGCETGFDCVSGTCVASAGAVCQADTDCASGVCAGRCCSGACAHENAACSGTCDTSGVCSYPTGSCSCGGVTGTCASGACVCEGGADGGGLGDGGLGGDGGAGGDGGTDAGERKSVLSCAFDPGAAAGVALPSVALLLAAVARRRRVRG
jgi:hypothetical protein